MAREREIVGILRILRGARGVKLTAKEGKWPAWFRRCRWEEAGVDVPRVRPLGLSPVGRVSAPFRVCRTPVGHLSGTCGNLSDSCRTPVALVGTFRTPVGHLWHLWEPFGLLSDTFRKPVGNLSGTLETTVALPLDGIKGIKGIKVSKVSKYQRYQGYSVI
jgi:hypothetical protein